MAVSFRGGPLCNLLAVSRPYTSEIRKMKKSFMRLRRFFASKLKNRIARFGGLYSNAMWRNSAQTRVWLFISMLLHHTQYRLEQPVHPLSRRRIARRAATRPHEQKCGLRSLL